MIIGMIKTKNDDDEVVTKGWFREAMRESIGEFAMIVNKSFVGVESRIGRLESRMDAHFEKIESTMAGIKEDILALTQRIDKLEKYVDNRFDGIARELKEIRKEIKTTDVRADIFDLRSRVTKLEQKAGL
jgi:predicted  nucleic acid-binding Zn-ribbon protein